MVNNSIRMDSNRARINSIARYIIVALIVVYIVCLLIFTSGSSKSFEKVAGPVEGAINKETMVKQKELDIKKLYGLNESEYDGVMLYVSSNNLSAEEVLLLKVKDKDQLDDVRKAIDKRLESRMNDFKGYAPEEEAYIDNAVVSFRGDYVFVSIGVDAEKLKEVFNENL